MFFYYNSSVCKKDILENGSSAEVQDILSSDFFKSMEVCSQLVSLA